MCYLLLPVTVIELREYQKRTIETLKKGFSMSHRRQVLCLPTGAGKTVIFSEMVRRATKKGTRCLVVTDRIELFDQTFHALGRIGNEPEMIRAESKNVEVDALLHVAMVETLSRRKKLISELKPDLIVIDEAHKGNFTKIIDAFPEAFVIGATATPVGKHFFEYYTNIVQPIDIPDLQNLGFLSQVKAYQMQDRFDDLKTSRGDFTDESLLLHFDRTNIYAGMIEKWKEKSKGRKTLVFNCNIEHAVKTHQKFLEAGVVSEVITSNTEKHERKRILEAYRSGDIPVLNNCGILTTGFDDPTIETIVMNRATKSLPLWLQCCGRGSRIAQGKEDFMILDFGGNHDRHGLWNEPREWKLEKPKRKRASEMAAPVKECKSCGAMMLLSARECPICNHVHEVEKYEKKGVLVEVGMKSELKGRKLSSLSIEELIHLQRVKRLKAALVWRVMRSRGEEELKRYGFEMQYSQGWLWRQKKEINNSKFVDYEI